MRIILTILAARISTYPGTLPRRPMISSCFNVIVLEPDRAKALPECGKDASS